VNATELRDVLRADLKTALRARDRTSMSALRSALSAVDNAESVPTDARAGAIEDASVGVGTTEATRRELSAADLRGILQQEVDERETAATEYDRQAPERAEQLRAEAAVVAAYASNVV
jgi:Uncharacterized conserved protein